MPVLAGIASRSQLTAGIAALALAVCSRMRLLIAPVLAVLAGCGHGPAAAATSAAAPQLAAHAGPPGPPAPAPPPASEAEIVEHSHAVIDAFYRGDLAWLRERYAPGFVRFEGQKLHPLPQEIERLERHGRRPAAFTRRWDEIHAYVRDHDAVFIGKATEHETGNDSHGARASIGWYTMTWARSGERWKVTHWSWQPYRTEIESLREVWNDTYRQAVGFNHEPNRLLVDTVKGKKPGRALDVMTGQGRNAIYLATQGWKVTGVDISSEGLRITRETAAARGVTVDTVETDVDHYDFGQARWDLVTMIYAGKSAELIAKIKPSIRRGGLFVVEYFVAGPTSCCGGFERGMPASLFGEPGWEILRDEVVEDAPDWATDRAELVRFVARKK